MGCSKNSAESREPDDDDDDNLPDDAYRVDEDEFLIRLDELILRLPRLYSLLRPNVSSCILDVVGTSCYCRPTCWSNNNLEMNWMRSERMSFLRMRGKLR